MLEISRCETQDAVAGVDQQVLSSIVSNEAIAMVSTVELNDQTGSVEEHVCATEDLPARTAQLVLNSRARQPRFQK